MQEQSQWMPTVSELDAIDKVVEAREEAKRVKFNARLDYIDLLDTQKSPATPAKNPYRYVKMYKNAIKTILLPRLITADKGFLFDVLPYLNRTTNILTDDKGRPLTQKGILEIVGCSRMNLSRVLKRLIEAEVIGKVRVNKQDAFKVNPRFFEG